MRLAHNLVDEGIDFFETLHLSIPALSRAHCGRADIVSDELLTLSLIKEPLGVVVIICS
jgi:hypothetical protein